MNKNLVILDTLETDNGTIYNCIRFNRREFEDSVKQNIDYKFEFITIPRKELGALLKNGYILENFKKGQMTLNSFKQHIKPMVILARIEAKGGKLLGFVVANYRSVGNIQKVPLKNLYKVCREIETMNRKHNLTGDKKLYPLQNAVVVISGDNSTDMNIKGKVTIPVIVLERTKVQAKKVEESATTTKTKNMESVFTKEQLAQLNEGKRKGISLQYIANPKLSPEQMKALRICREMGVNIQPFAKSVYSYKNMLLIGSQAKSGVSGISAFLNPEFTPARLLILQEADILGLDLSKLIDVNMSDEDTREVMIRLSNNFWAEYDSEGKYKHWV